MAQPNILVIICDQLSAQALPAWGNDFASTPNINALISSGVSFDSAYSNCPLCQPSRASFWTSRYPHQTGVLANGEPFPVSSVNAGINTLGTLFHHAGYETVHFGKQHDAGALRGFQCVPIQESETEPAHPSLSHNYDTRQDRYTRQRAVDFLESYSKQKPFLAVTDFNNPHNICGWIGENAEARPLKKTFDLLPSLPDNLYLSESEFSNRPIPIRYLASAHRRQAQISEWDELKIRHYLHAYHHYLSLVDSEIGHILNALHQRDDAQDTLVVFFSDHGDSMCGRWMATKHTSFYEETMHVPLAFSGAGIEPKDHRIEGLCSLLDLLPTLCDFADIIPPQDIEGRSLYEAITADHPTLDLHQAVYAQWHTEWGHTIEPGRMVRTPRYKYTHYRECYGTELYDLQTDPGETHNLAFNPEYTDILKNHHDLLNTYITQSNDPYWSMDFKVDPVLRQHKPTYRNYQGPLSLDVVS
ncbi:sulfatase family protein [Rubellicoccus peritrichatus]|uniref:Sulfatase-like hydrolase/transferase n=1 Tax=Rubellicoccus peritrichatus TaxID=3080537 RepID=A0AAQ3QRV5_9BACT|nr:sulfatase-like hydrolase/transferase [Puniceicoccus sp. CR14]WOO39676.1 sulfatase-like hydrolase/transferase [Puniceicoccus sp. CR14]